MIEQVTLTFIGWELGFLKKFPSSFLMCSKVWKSLSSVQFSSIQFSLSVMSDSLQSHEPQHAWISDLFYCSQHLPTYYTVWDYFQYFLKTKLINWHESDLFHYHCHENIIIVIKNNKITRIITNMPISTF